MIFVCGHQNPDTDSIVAAIAYSRFLGLDKAAPVRLGDLSPETAFVLDRFGFSPPEYLPSARTQVKDIVFDEPTTAAPDTPILEAWNAVRDKKTKTLLVTDSGSRLLGVATSSDFAEALVNHINSPDAADKNVSNLSGELASGAHPVSEIMRTENITAFSPEDYVDDVNLEMLSNRYRLYPVIDESGRVLGTLARFHLINCKRKQFVLVDHNEKSQSIPGLEQADILEIFDHHRLGDIQTGMPMFFHNEPVGSTTTIIAGLYHEAGQIPPRDLAGLMLAGILSDTIIYKSPTCTIKDTRMARWLSNVSKLDDYALGKELFTAFDKSLADRTPKDLLFHDFKEYIFGSKKIGVGQVTTWDSEAIPTQKINDIMREMRVSERFDLLLFMQTEIHEEGSLILYSAANHDIVRRAFSMDGANGEPFFLPGVMSRKQQVIPAIRAALI